MNARVVAFPSTGIAKCNADIAKHLRDLAEEFERDGATEIRNVVTLVEHKPDGSLAVAVVGDRIDNARLVGILEFAKFQQVLK